MAANIYRPTPKEWEIISNFLSQAEAGVVIITPEAQSELALAGIKLEELTYIQDYDFGGEADLWVDVCRTANDYAASKIRRAQSP